MTRKFFALMLALLFTLDAASAFADTKKPKARSPKSVRQTNQLVASLPASDAVLFFDLQRFLNEALPQMLLGSPEKLAEINAKIDEIKNHTGLDVRQFEQIAVGAAVRGKAVDPLILTRGKFNAPVLLAAARLALNDKVREEKIGGKTVYVFSAKELLTEHKAKMAGGSPLIKILDSVLNKMPSELAVTTFDANTLAIGSSARVRETFESKTRIGAELAGLVNRKPSSFVSFGANTPSGMAQFFELDDDEIGQSLTSIRQLYGTIGASGANTLVSINAKSTNAVQAKSLEENLIGLQGLGKGLLSGAKSGDKKVYLGLIENLKVTRAGLVVALDTQVSNADLSALIK